MHDEILAVGRIRCARFYRVPGEDHRSKLATGFARPNHLSLLPDVILNLSYVVSDVYRRVNENRKETRKVISLAVQQKEAGLCRDSHADLFGRFQAITTFKALFIEKYPDVIQKFLLIVGRKPAEKRHVAFDDLKPGVWKRLSPQPSPPSALQQSKSHGEM